MDKPELLYFYPKRSSFVAKDSDIFSLQYSVKEFEFNSEKSLLSVVWLFTQQLFFILRNLRAKKIVCQFAGHHSMIPSVIGKISGKQVYIVAAGTDCVSFPEINYGNFAKPFMAFSSRITYRNCTLVLPVYRTLMHAEYTYFPSKIKKQGIYPLSGEKPPFIEVQYGYDSELWRPISEIERIKKSFITVAFDAQEKKIFTLKGIDIFLKLSKKMPDCLFTIVGVTGEWNHEKPENLTILPAQNREQLNHLFSQHTFYCQLSISEGFPNALAEAMLCGCIPIVSNISAMPEIVKECGIVLQQKDENKLTELAREAFSQDLEMLATKSREKIIRDYPLGRRINELLEAISS